MKRPCRHRLAPLASQRPHAHAVDRYLGSAHGRAYAAIEICTCGASREVSERGARGPWRLPQVKVAR